MQPVPLGLTALQIFCFQVVVGVLDSRSRDGKFDFLLLIVLLCLLFFTAHALNPLGGIPQSLLHLADGCSDCAFQRPKPLECSCRFAFRFVKLRVAQGERADGSANPFLGRRSLESRTSARARIAGHHSASVWR